MLREHVGRLEDVRLSVSPDYMPYYTAYEQRAYFAPWSPTPGTGWYFPVRDDFAFYRVGRSELPGPITNIAERTSHVPAAVSSRYIQWMGLPPIPSDLNVSEGVRQGEAFTKNAFNLFSGNWRFVSRDMPMIKGENPVTHFNIVGEVSRQDGQTYIRPIDSAYTSADLTPLTDHAVLSYDMAAQQLYYTPVGFKSNWAPYDSTCDFHFLYMMEHLPETVEYPGPGTFKGVGITSSIQYNITVTYSDDGVSPCGFDYIHEECWTYPYDTKLQIWRRYNIHIDVDWQYVDPVYVPYGETCWTTQMYSVILKYTYTRISQHNRTISPSVGAWNQVLGTDVPKTFTHALYPYFGCELSVHDSSKTAEALLKSNATTGQVTSVSYNLLKEFESSIMDNARRFYPAVCHSSKEAVEYCLADLSANHLENLSDLGEIRQFINPLDGFLKLAQGVSSGNPIRVLRGLLDLLADSYLLYRFGIAPTLDDAREISERVGPLRARLLNGTMFHYGTFNGKFTFNLPDDTVPPYSSLRLTARSKVVARVSPNSLLAAILPFESFGLFPTLSRMWDLIPFSFVVDWATDIGSRLEDFDTVIKVLLMDVKFSTHSVKVSWNVDDELLADRSLRVIEDPILSYYVRSTMNRVPTIAYTDIDFNEPSSFSNWGTALALLWQFL